MNKDKLEEIYQYPAAAYYYLLQKKAMKKLELEYVASVYSRLGMFVEKILKDYKDEYKPHITKVTQKVNQYLEDQCNHISPSLSILYNCYTEWDYPSYFE